MNDAAEIPISEMGGGGLQRCVYYKRRPERIGPRGTLCLYGEVLTDGQSTF